MLDLKSDRELGLREWVLEQGGRVAKRRGSEGAGGCGYMEEVRKRQGSEVMDSLEGKNKYYVVYTAGEQLCLMGWGYVCNDMNSWVQDKL